MTDSRDDAPQSVPGPALDEARLAELKARNNKKKRRKAATARQAKGQDLAGQTKVLLSNPVVVEAMQLLGEAGI